MAQPNVDKEQFAESGLAVYNRIDNELKRPNSNLYAESVSLSGVQSGGSGGFAFVWPAGIQFRVLNALVRHDPATYTPVQRAFSDDLVARYWRFTSAGGYRSGVTSGSTVFYDDNAHIVIAEMDAYASTGDPVYLQRARNTYNFVLRGEDNVAGGGIWFQENLFTHKDSISTLQGARAAATLYRATGEQRFLDDATRLLDWANTHVQQRDRLFSQGYDVSTNLPEGVAIVNSAGVGISANVELYKATLEPSYLMDAKRIAARSLNRYTDLAGTRSINDEGYWAFEFADALVDLYEVDPLVVWSDTLWKGLTFLHDVKEDVNGHYGTFWGREPHPTSSAPFASWNLIEQAPVARAYLSVSQMQQGLLGDYNEDGVVDHADYMVWHDRVGESVVRLPNAYGAGAIGTEQYEMWLQNYGNHLPGVEPPAPIVPEPCTGAIMSVFVLMVLNRRQLRCRLR